MIEKLQTKIRENLLIYRKDLKIKGILFSIIHRLYKIPHLKTFLKPAVNFFKPDFVMIGKSKIYIDKSDSTVSENLLFKKRWEEYEVELYKKGIKPGDIILDIGAHIGYYTVIASLKVGANGKVYAFEPDPKNFKLLKKNVEENKCTNVVLENKAVSDKSGKMRLYLNTENTGDHRTFDSKDNRKSISIDSISLDKYFKNNQKINLIKMDIQGGELSAVRGAKNLLKRSSGLVIFTEFWPAGLKLNHNSAKDYLKFLTLNKFNLYQILEEEEKLIPIDSRKLLKLFPEKNLDYTNLLCKKS